MKLKVMNIASAAAPESLFERTSAEAHIQVAPSPQSQSSRDETSTTTAPSARGTFFTGIMAVLLLTVAAIVAVAAPAHAVSYRDLKSVRYGTCLHAFGDPLEGIQARLCSATPAKYGNWRITRAGYYNNHPLWIIKRQGGTCLGVYGRASSNYLYSSCAATDSSNVWEVFTTSSKRYVLKSFGAYQSWGQHKCLTFSTSYGTNSVNLDGCSLTSTANQIYR